MVAGYLMIDGRSMGNDRSMVRDGELALPGSCQAAVVILQSLSQVETQLGYNATVAIIHQQLHLPGNCLTLKASSEKRKILSLTIHTVAYASPSLIP